MTTADSYVQFVMEHAIPPPRTSGAPLHWDGLGAASRSVDLTPRSAPRTRAAVRAQGQLMAGGGTTPSVTPQPKRRGTMPSVPTIHWATEAARMTLYVALDLLKATRDHVLREATGTLVWVFQAAPGVCLTPTVHPVLLVQTAFATCQEACSELVPRLPADDPLCHHMALVLQTAFEAEDVVDRLYATSLAEALAIHFLRRYRTCGHPPYEVPGGLSPAKLQRTTAYIQAHLEQEVSLMTLATLVHLSPDHFARLFKHATGQTPHHYVLGCRIARAKQLLAETDLPLSTISLQVGCTDQSYFTALFRQHVTMTPKAYRDAMTKA